MRFRSPKRLASLAGKKTASSEEFEVEAMKLTETLFATTAPFFCDVNAIARRQAVHEPQV